MGKRFSKSFSWVFGLALAMIVAFLSGKLFVFLGISNSGIISIASTFIGMICGGLYRNALKFIKSEEYRLRVREQQDIINNNIRKEREALKRKTIVELYLLSERKTFLKVKLLSVVMIYLGALLSYSLDYSPVITIAGIVAFVLLEVKERVLGYRISKGFYGNNSVEAIQLLKFIEANIDKIDDGRSGGSRRILNLPGLSESLNEHSGKGVLDVR